MIAIERERSFGMQIGLFAGDVQRIKAQAIVGQHGMKSAIAFEMHTVKRDGQFAQTGLAMHGLGMVNRTIDRDVACKRGLAVEAGNFGELEQGGNVEAREVNAEMCVVRRIDERGAVGDECGRGQMRSHLVLHGLARCLRLHLEVAE